MINPPRKSRNAALIRKVTAALLFPVAAIAIACTHSPKPKIQSQDPTPKLPTVPAFAATDIDSSVLGKLEEYYLPVGLVEGGNSATIASLPSGQNVYYRIEGNRLVAGRPYYEPVGLFPLNVQPFKFGDDTFSIKSIATRSSARFVVQLTRNGKTRTVLTDQERIEGPAILRAGPKGGYWLVAPRGDQVQPGGDSFDDGMLLYRWDGSQFHRAEVVAQKLLPPHFSVSEYIPVDLDGDGADLCLVIERSQEGPNVMHAIFKIENGRVKFVWRAPPRNPLAWSLDFCGVLGTSDEGTLLVCQKFRWQDSKNGQALVDVVGVTLWHNQTFTPVVDLPGVPWAVADFYHDGKREILAQVNVPSPHLVLYSVKT
jgi:hypothetical protein